MVRGVSGPQGALKPMKRVQSRARASASLRRQACSSPATISPVRRTVLNGEAYSYRLSERYHLNKTHFNSTTF